jgi:NhaA family Na+:H+ antiporter
MAEAPPAEHPPLARKLPTPPVAKFTRPLVHFLQIESAGGLVLLVCTVVALALANSRWASDYFAFWHTHVALHIGDFSLGGELGHFFVNDVLMTIFFFVVGLEIKRELVAGELRDPRKAALPIAAAFGGMVVPAGIYLALQYGQPGERGWGVPMATDIAFVVGVMALLGRRVPFGLKIMLLSLAIADDIGAVIVIAMFYSTNLSWGMLAAAAVGFVVIYGLNRVGVRTVPMYAAVGAFIWFAFYRSGVHPTVAGVLLGLMTPSSAWIGDKTLVEVLEDAIRRAPGEGHERNDMLQTVQFTAREGLSPLHRLETLLHPWVGFVIMPIFALANAGVTVEVKAVSDPVAVAVALGLFFGKPIGIVLASWISVRLGIAKLPSGANWWMMLGAGSLGGIGFTMSLFVANLAFVDPAHLSDSKIGILTGSFCSAIAGTIILSIAGAKGKTVHDAK